MFYVFILPIKLLVTFCTGELFIIVVDCIFVATPMLMTQVKYLTLPSTPKGATIYEYPSHHESYAVAPPPPGHSYMNVCVNLRKMFITLHTLLHDIRVD
jgi:hypothetical protein